MNRQRYYHYRNSIQVNFRLRARHWGRGLDLIESVNGHEKVHELTPTMLELLRSPLENRHWNYRWMGCVTRKRFRDTGITESYWNFAHEALTQRGHAIRNLVISVCGPRNGQEPFYLPLTPAFPDDEA